jgi:Phage major capsid protein E
MPDIPLLQPRVLNGFIIDKPFPQNLLGLQLVNTREPYPFPVWAYDIIRGNILMSKPNVPNSEAHIRGQQGVGAASGAFIYMRDKKLFEATTLYWLRMPGTLAARNAEFAVAREVKDLDDGIERFVEWCIWKMFITGTLVVRRPDAPVVNINYQVPSNHVVVPSTLWSDLINADILGNLAAWKQIIVIDSTFIPTDIFLTTNTFNLYVLQNAKLRSTLSNEQRAEYVETGTVRGLAGFAWTAYDLAYIDDWTTPGTPTTTNYIPDGKLLMASLEGDPFKIWEGLSSDHQALATNPNYTGKFTKSWIEEDPSNRIVLEEYPFVPIMQRPYNILVSTVI